MEELIQPVEQVIPLREDIGPDIDTVYLLIENTQSTYNSIQGLKDVKELTQEEEYLLQKGISHIEIMLKKPWFVQNLTPTQLSNFQNII